jgi:hypothetical protein
VSSFSRYIACFLLVVFARVLVPDALILKLHAHTHTEHALEQDEHHPKLEQAHSHCPVENVFQAPFQLLPASPEISALIHSDAYSAKLSPIRDFSFPATVTLRGPPVG